MSSPDYKGPGRRETARRVRERSEGVNPSRGLDEALDDRIERETDEERSRACPECGAGPGQPCTDFLFGEPMRWHHTAREEALKVPDPSGCHQDRGPDSPPTERGSNKDGA